MNKGLKEDGREPWQFSGGGGGSGGKVAGRKHSKCKGSEVQHAWHSRLTRRPASVAGAGSVRGRPDLTGQVSAALLCYRCSFTVRSMVIVRQWMIFHLIV